MTEQTITQSNLKAYIVSDVHLNNNSYDKHSNKENSERKNFQKFLTELNINFPLDAQIILILNGDIFDITGSWSNSVLPWDNDKEKVENILKDLVLEIIENNKLIIDELRQFLKHPLSRIVYVTGNHDSLLGKYPGAQELIKGELLNEIPEDLHKNKHIDFVKSFEYPDLGLYVEHGHRFDPFNISSNDHEPTLGDVINILVVNRFVKLIAGRLESHGYSLDLISNIKSHLYDIEYLRPLSLLPFWIESIANIYCDHPECEKKKESIESIFRSVILELHKDPWIIKYLSKKLHVPRFFLIFFINLTAWFPKTLSALSFVISKLLRRTHSNNFQNEVAKSMHEEKGYRMIVFGHTHIPTVAALSPKGYYCNTGSWTPVINLFKYSEHKLSHMEYLTAEPDFKKVERSGILEIAKDLELPESSPSFLLKTVQSGFD